MVAAAIAKPAQNVGAERNPGTPALVPNPFVRAAREVRIPFIDVTSPQLSANSSQAGPFDVASFGFIRNLVFLVESVSAAGAATFTADGAFAALRDIQLLDTNGNPIFVPLDGMECIQINKLTGAATVFNQALQSAPSYAQTPASGAFAYKFRLPLEIGIREGLGAVPNMSASAPFKVQWTWSPVSAVYSANPATTVPNVRVRVWGEFYSQPPAVDARGNPNMVAPPFMGTTSYWSKQVINVPSTGQQTFRINRTGNLWRNIILITKDGTGARIGGMLPLDSIMWQWDSKIMDNFSLSLLNDQVYERVGAAADTGCYLYDFSHDFISKVGGAAEGRNLYWPTTQASRIELVGNFRATGTLTVLVNDVIPQEGAVYTQAQ